jgi:hypothetical protein
MGGLTWLAATDDAVPGSTPSARVCWLVRVSLAQTGKWLIDRGEVPEAALKDVPTEIPQADIDRWSIDSDAPAGRLRHLGPTVRLSETPPYWAHPSCRSATTSPPGPLVPCEALDLPLTRDQSSITQSRHNPCHDQARQATMGNWAPSTICGLVIPNPAVILRRIR